jgi:3-oxoacyl-[acyl-carrier-protein] synthase-1
MPAGLCPGEAAAALLLQRASDPFRSSCGTQATIRFADTRPAPAPLNAEDPEASRVALAPEIGKRLADIALAALGPALAKSPAGDVIVDLNGEVWRSLVWGHASSLLQGKVDVSGMRLVVPSASFGEIGAVSAVAGICAAARSFGRKYAAGPWALVLSISDAGDTAAILVETPESAP